MYLKLPQGFQPTRRLNWEFFIPGCSLWQVPEQYSLVLIDCRLMGVLPEGSLAEAIKLS